MNKKKVAIIGAGPAGITASIYLKRAGIDFSLFEKNMPGGKLSLTHKINNYPGYSSISGTDLAFQMMNQLQDNNIEITYEEILDVIKENNQFILKTKVGNRVFDAVIVASGSQDKKLNVPGEKELFGKGVSTCAVCDGSFFKGKPMAIIGNNNRALEEAIYLSSITETVYLIIRRDELIGEQINIDKVLSDDHIRIIRSSIVTSINGTNNVESISLQDINTKNESSVDVSAAFVYIGSDSNSSFISFDNIFDNKGFIIVNNDMETNIEGLFACGDCINKKLRQIVTATSDGAIAAISASSYLKK